MFRVGRGEAEVLFAPRALAAQAGRETSLSSAWQ